MARALILVGLLLATASAGARAQTVELCALDGLGREAVESAIALELGPLEGADLAGLRVIIDECGESALRVRLFMDDRVIEMRSVPLDDVAPSARPRLLSYVVVEMILLATEATRRDEPGVPAPPSPIDPTTATPSDVADSAPRSGAAREIRGHGEAHGLPARAALVTTVQAEPPEMARRWALEDRRPLEWTLDAGVRWYTAPSSHLATLRFTIAVDRLLLETRYTFGPMLREARPIAPNGRPQPSCPFHVPTLAVGFRQAFRFGDDAIFLDGLGYAGAVWTPTDDGFRDSVEGRARYGMGGLEARVGLDVGLGPVRATLSLEFGYAQGRRVRYEDPLRPVPLRYVSGPYVGATLGMGFAKLAR